MRPIRFRLDRLMLWVAVAAINLAAFRFLFATRSIIHLAGGMMAWIMIQVGASRALRDRRGGRIYWLGFVAGGSIATMSMLSTGYLPSSIMGSIWQPYFALLEVLFEWSEPWLIWLFGNGGADEIAYAVLLSMACFLPVWLSALAGGHLCHVLFLRRNPLADLA